MTYLSKTKEYKKAYRRKFEYDQYKVYPKKYIVVDSHSNCKRCDCECQDYKTCQLYEKFNHERCQHYLNKKYSISSNGNKYKK